MRLRVPRISPLPESEWTAEMRELIPKGPTGGGPLNIFTTLIRHPGLFKRWMVFGNHVLGKSTLPVRERELVILRTGWRCKSVYEFRQHTRIGLQCGLTKDEIRRLTLGVDAWSGPDALLVQASDQLHDDQFIADVTWQALREHWSEQQLMDLVFTIGQYTLVSMALNTFGVQLEDGSQEFLA
jgi:4-carboxymuconolactone decarboxylase